MQIPALLRKGEFGRFFVGQSVSLLGDQFTVLAIPMTAVLLLHAGPTQMGLLTAVGLLPNLFLSLTAGAWIDRHGHRRSAMLFSDIVRGLAISSVPAAYAFDSLHIIHLYVVAFIVGIFNVIFGVAYQSLLVTLVDRTQYVAASSWLNGSRAVTQAFGLTLGGVAVSILTPAVALLLDAGSFFVSARQLATIKPTEPPGVGRGRASGVAPGLRWIVHQPVVRILLGSSAVTNVGVYMSSAVLILHAVRRLHLSPTAVGIALGAGAIGGLIGAMTCQRVESRLGLGRLLVAASLIYPVAFLFFPLAPPSVTALGVSCIAAGEFIAFLGAVWADISVGAVLAQAVPDDLRSRVSGAYRTVNYGVRPLGALIGGLLASVTGTRATLLIGAIICLIGGTLTARRPLLALRSAQEG